MKHLYARVHRIVHRTVFVSAALVVTVGHVPAAWAQGQIFVTNYNSDSITVYSRSANGEVGPSSTISGQFGDNPHHIAIDRGAGELFVANFGSDSVAVYDWVTGTLKRRISGASTGLGGPAGVAVDPVNREVYVANYSGNSVTVYDILATGNALPKRSLLGGGYFMAPVAVAIDLTHDEIVVTLQGFHEIRTFDRLADGFMVGLDKRRLSSGLSWPIGVTLDLAHDEILVADSNFVSPNSGSILAFRRTDTGDVAPIRRLEGSATMLCNPLSVALDLSVDELVVANSNVAPGSCPQSITTYTRTATGNTAPKRTLAGALTALNVPSSAAITSASTLTLKNKALNATVNAGDNVGYAITAAANGGPVSEVVLTAVLPSGLAWSPTANVSTCTFSPAPENKLTCSVGQLAKGQSLSIQALAKSTTANCPKIVNQATVSYNDGTAVVVGVPQLTSISIKCK
jgi:Domain of unknown function DUF11/Lactonase, 7-bladed beta-propeller